MAVDQQYFTGWLNPSTTFKYLVACDWDNCLINGTDYVRGVDFFYADGVKFLSNNNYDVDGYAVWLANGDNSATCIDATGWYTRYIGERRAVADLQGGYSSNVGNPKLSNVLAQNKTSGVKNFHDCFSPTPVLTVPNAVLCNTYYRVPPTQSPTQSPSQSPTPTQTPTLFNGKVVNSACGNVRLFTTSGSWTVPAGVNLIKLLVVGGGGGGNHNKAGGPSIATGNGAPGKGGQVVTANVSVNPGETYTIVVGAGGKGGSDWGVSETGYSGSQSSFGTFVAAGGTGGGGSGGQGTPSIELGVNVAVDGSTGGQSSAPGSGGGGGTTTNAVWGFNGGTGNDGIVLLCYSIATPTPTSTPTSTPTRTFTQTPTPSITNTVTQLPGVTNTFTPTVGTVSVHPIACYGNSYVATIDIDECIGDSLAKINSNFKNLDLAVCTLSSNGGGNCSDCSGTSSPLKFLFYGNGMTRAYTLETNKTLSPDALNYRVDIDGTLQEPNVDYSINTTTYPYQLVFVTAPILTEKIVVLTYIPTVAGTNTITTVLSTTNTVLLSTLVPTILDNVPVGVVTYFAVSAAPVGYLECNGRSLNTTIYSELFNVIGYSYGGSGNAFNLPDLRGEFVRGWDHNRGVDSGRALGSRQDDAFGSHNHTLTDPGHAHSYSLPDNSNGAGSGDAYASIYAANNPAYGRSTSSTTTGITIASIGGTETRPRNVALLPCIKYVTVSSLNALGATAADLLAELNRFELDISQYLYAGINQIRLSLTTNPVPVAGVTDIASSTLYIHPYNGNAVTLFDRASNKWVPYTITTPIPVSLNGLAAYTNYDIFLYSLNGKIAASFNPWSDSTIGAQPPVKDNTRGTLTQVGDVTKKYVGCLRTTAAGTCELKFGYAGQQYGSDPKIFLWNQYNRKPVSYVLRFELPPYGGAKGTTIWNTSSKYRTMPGSGADAGALMHAFGGDDTHVATGAKVSFICGEPTRGFITSNFLATSTIQYYTYGVNVNESTMSKTVNELMNQQPSVAMFEGGGNGTVVNMPMEGAFVGYSNIVPLLATYQPGTGTFPLGMYLYNATTDQRHTWGWQGTLEF
jgi:microcystin-dependent protein